MQFAISKGISETLAVHPTDLATTDLCATSKRPPDPAWSPLWWSETSYPDDATISLHNQRIAAQTISGKLIYMLIIVVLIWLQSVIVTALRGQMLTFHGVRHVGEVFYSQMNPGFHCSDQMADSMCGVACVWAVCWCQCCGSSGPRWRWGDGVWLDQYTHQICQPLSVFGMLWMREANGNHTRYWLVFWPLPNILKKLYILECTF